MFQRAHRPNRFGKHLPARSPAQRSRPPNKSRWKWLIAIVTPLVANFQSAFAASFPGPDAFGYTASAIGANLRDISASGTFVPLGDDHVSGAISIPFAFSFYGNSYSELYISSNGFLTFSATSANGCCSGQNLPNPSAPNNLIAGYWEDLNYPQGNISYQALGSAPNREFVVGFYNNPHYSNGPRVTFEMILHEGTNAIELQYGDAPGDGGTHTVGIENADGTVALQIAHGNVSYSSLGYLIQAGPRPLDLGDAPAIGYPTLIGQDGARHAVGPLFLGQLIDSEADAQPAADANGDDTAGDDDEDGIRLDTLILGDQLASLTVESSGGGKLDGWIDFNVDGDWDDPGELIFDSVDVMAGSQTLSFVVPSPSADVGETTQTFARFRLSTAGGLDVVGAAPDGEVEDYPVALELPTLTIFDPLPVNEGDVGTTDLEFTVQLSHVVSHDVSFDISTVDGTAEDGNGDGDYTAVMKTVVMAAGEDEVKVSVPIAGDMNFENDETFLVRLANAVGAKIEPSDTTATGTILNDDAMPAVTLSVVGSPLAEDGGVATVTAALSNLSVQDVTVALVFSGSAESGDYAASAPRIVITGGSPSGSMTLTGVADAVFEGDEDIVVDIDAVTNGSEDGAQTVIATITDDESQPAVNLSLADSPFSEDGGMATVTATLSNASTQDVTVDLIFGGTAAGNDYTASAPQVVITAGALSGSVTLTGLGDLIYEQTETVTVGIDTVTNGVTGANSSVLASILNNDPAPVPTPAPTASPMPTSVPESSPTPSASPTPGPVVTPAPTVTPAPSPMPGVTPVPTPDDGEASGGLPPQDGSVPPGSKGLALLTFGVRNPADEAALVSMFTARLVDNDDHLAVEEVRLVVDANANGRADAGEEILARLNSIPEEGTMQFNLDPQFSIAADATVYFVVVVDFR